MPALHVRNVPEPVIAALRERAERHGQSMQREIVQILTEATSRPIVGQPGPPIRLITVKTHGKSTWRREEIYSDEGR